MADRPNFYSLIDLDLTNIDILYAESPLNRRGNQPGQVIESKPINTLLLSGGLWETYFDYRTIRTNDYVDLATTQQWSSTKLAYPIGSSVVAGPGAAPDTGAVYFFDGYRVEIDEYILKPAGAHPLKQVLAIKPGRLWVYLTTAAISDPGQPFAATVVRSVAAGVPSSPGANELALVGVDIDVAGVITGNTYPATEPGAEVVYSTRMQRFLGTVTHEDLVTITKSGGLALKVVGRIDIDGEVDRAVIVFTDTALDPAVEIVNDSGISATLTNTTSSLALPTLLVTNAGVGGPAITAVKTTLGPAAVVDSSTGGEQALLAFGGSYGVQASSTLGVGVEGTTTSGTGVSGGTSTGSAVLGTSTSSGAAVSGVGGPSVASRAGLFTAGDTGAVALRASTFAGATSSAIALQGFGNADSVGVEGASSSGYGVVASSDTTSPKRAAFRLVPQDDDPTTFLQGDMLFNSARAATGKVRVRTTQWESVHSSNLGRVWSFGAPANAVGVGGGSGPLSATQIEPEEVGEVLVTGTASFVFSSDQGSCDLELWDLTSNVLIATQLERSMDTDGFIDRQRSVIIRGTYTVPNTLVRTFGIVFTTVVGNISYTNLITEVQGMQ